MPGIQVFPNARNPGFSGNPGFQTTTIYKGTQVTTLRLEQRWDGLRAGICRELDAAATKVLAPTHHPNHHICIYVCVHEHTYMRTSTYTFVFLCTCICESDSAPQRNCGSLDSTAERRGCWQKLKYSLLSTSALALSSHSRSHLSLSFRLFSRPAFSFHCPLRSRYALHRPDNKALHVSILIIISVYVYVYMSILICIRTSTYTFVFICTCICESDSAPQPVDRLVSALHSVLVSLSTVLLSQSTVC